MILAGLGPREQAAADQFRAFYALLAATRDDIRAFWADEAGPVPTDADGVRLPPTIAEVRARLAHAITAMGFHHEQRRAQPVVDAGYVMAAVADEVLLTQCGDWPDYAAWADVPLEAVLYGSRLSGDRLFTAADELLGHRRADPGAAVAILLALIVGFRGRYQRDEGEEAIDAWKRDLYRLVLDEPYDVADVRPYAAPDLRASLLTGRSVRPLPRLWPWLAGLALVLALYLPLSHFVWWLGVREIDRLASEVVAASPGDVAYAP